MFNYIEKIHYYAALIKSMYNFIFVEWRQFNFKKSDIVADFGCGGRPLPRANIIVDKFIEGITERPTEFLDTGAIIVQSDLSRLPFKDKSVDFVYMGHVVEHLDKLNESLKEVNRVAGGGCNLSKCNARASFGS